MKRQVNAQNKWLLQKQKLKDQEHAINQGFIFLPTTGTYIKQLVR